MTAWGVSALMVTYTARGFSQPLALTQPCPPGSVTLLSNPRMPLGSRYPPTGLLKLFLPNTRGVSSKWNSHTICSCGPVFFIALVSQTFKEEVSRGDTEPSVCSSEHRFPREAVPRDSQPQDSSSQDFTRYPQSGLSSQVGACALAFPS